MIHFGIVIALLIGAGALLAARAKSAPGMRWVGYALILMTVFLVAIAVTADIYEASHYE
ncbi:hypothetical protein [Paenibacillus flagellatus]|uniref:hypothetical protein n=1 Tax=Paenibacillus flagellatus TaxID=2211139 RepID=UPI0013053454|nr:hypothetical protein [Paenibacillus flagellatus]